MASGDELNKWDNSAGKPPTTLFAIFKRANTNQRSHFVQEFPAGASNELIFSGFWSPNYAAGGVSFLIHWGATNNNTGLATWGVSLELVTTVSAPVFGTEQTGSVAGPGTTGTVAVATVNFTHGQLPAISAGDPFRLLLRRLTGGYTGNPQLFGIRAVEQ